MGIAELEAIHNLAALESLLLDHVLGGSDRPAIEAAIQSAATP